MEELHRIVLNGEQSLQWLEFQAAVKECQQCSLDSHDSDSAGAEGPSMAAAAVSEETTWTCRAVKMTLENEELWKQFNTITNEMIVTKAGRRMFPLLQVSVSGLDPAASYVLLLEFQLTDVHRWRFLNGEWQAATAAATCSEPPQQKSVYIHPSSPLKGSQWMKEKVTFSKLKLSNKEDGKGKMKLHSLYRYQPRLHIVQLPSSQLNEGDAIKGCGLSTHVFAETHFVAVTAYQNDKITQMKIKHNPYAKAFQGPQDTIHFSRTSIGDNVTTSHTMTTLHFHQSHTLSNQMQVTPTYQGVLAQPSSSTGHVYNWLPSSSQYRYNPYYTTYHTPSGCDSQSRSCSSGNYYNQQQGPYRGSGASGLSPTEIAAGQSNSYWVLPQRQPQSEQQLQTWYSSSSDGSCVQTCSSHTTPLEYQQ